MSIMNALESKHSHIEQGHTEAYKTPEIRTTVERHAVRAITLQLRPVEDYIADIFPSDDVIEDGGPYYDFPELTSSIMEVKNDHAVNKRQVMLPGGKIRSKSKDNPTEEEIEDSINAKIWDELHLNPTNIRILPLPVRRVSFTHERLFGKKKPGTLINHEHFTVATVAPFDRQIKVFNPRDNLETTLRLPPTQLFALLEQEEYTLSNGKRVTLLDSLCADSSARQRTGTTIQDDPSLYKEAIYEQAVIYEAHMIQAVVNQLVETTNATLPPSIREQIEEFRAIPPATDIDSAEYCTMRARTIAGHIQFAYTKDRYGKTQFRYLPKERVAYFKNKGVAELDNARRWEHFVQEFAYAYNQVALQQTVELTKKNGPQQAYILAQIIPNIEQFSHVEYKILAQNPMIKHIIDTPLRVFHIDPNNPHWHRRLREKLIKIQSWQYHRDAQVRRNFQMIAEQIDSMFCNPQDPRVPRIASTKQLGTHSENANEFKRHLRREIGPIASPEVAYAIASNPFGSDTHDTLELIYRAFGLNQYNANKPTIPVSEQNAAWTKLLLELTDKEVLDMWTEATTVSIKPIRGAFDTMFDEPMTNGATIHTTVYPRYTMNHEVFATYSKRFKPEQVVLVNGTVVHMENYPIRVVSNIRVKNLLELKRKWLERTNRKEDGSVDLTDFFGFFIALDDEQFLQDLYAYHPDLNSPLKRSIVDDILVQWKRYATTVVVKGMEDLIVHTGHEAPVLSRDKGRITAPYLQNIVPVKEQEGGSASSKSTWDWLKYVLHVQYKNRRLDVEQQMYPDLKSLRAKIADDSVFHIHRLFDKPTNRYPIMWIMFAAQEGYEEMLRLHNDARYIAKHYPAWKRRLGASLMGYT